MFPPIFKQTKKEKLPETVENLVGEPCLSGGKVFWPVVRIHYLENNETIERVLDFYTTKRAAENAVKELKGD